MTPRQTNAGNEQRPRGTTNRTPSAAARCSASRFLLRRNWAACAVTTAAEGAPVVPAKRRARPSSTAGWASAAAETVSQAVSQDAPRSNAILTAVRAELTGGDVDRARTSMQRSRDSPAASMDAVRSIMSAGSSRPTLPAPENSPCAAVESRCSCRADRCRSQHPVQRRIATTAPVTGFRLPLPARACSTRFCRQSSARLLHKERRRPGRNQGGPRSGQPRSGNLRPSQTAAARTGGGR